MSRPKLKSYTLMRRFYIDACWTASAESLEAAAALLNATQPKEVVAVPDGEVNDWGTIPGYDSVSE